MSRESKSESWPSWGWLHWSFFVYTVIYLTVFYLVIWIKISKAVRFDFSLSLSVVRVCFYLVIEPLCISWTYHTTNILKFSSFPSTYLKWFILTYVFLNIFAMQWLSSIKLYTYCFSCFLGHWWVFSLRFSSTFGIP